MKKAARKAISATEPTRAGIAAAKDLGDAIVGLASGGMTTYLGLTLKPGRDGWLITVRDSDGRLEAGHVKVREVTRDTHIDWALLFTLARNLGDAALEADAA